MRVSISVFVVVLIVLVSPACAGTDPALNSCLSLPAQGQRIDCFDEKIVERKGTGYITKIINAANWHVQIDKSVINDEPIVSIYVYANESVWYEGYGYINPELIIVCNEGETKLFVNFEKKIIDERVSSTSMRVIYRIDSKRSVESHWDISNTLTAVGLWDSQASISLIKNMIGREQFAFRTFPYGQGIYTVTFEITNLDVAIEYVRLACDW